MEITDNNDNEAKINNFYYILYVISNSFPIIPNQENRNKLIKYLTNFKQNNLNFNLDNFLKHNENDLTNFNFELDNTIDIVKNDDFNKFISKQKKENEILKNNFLKKNKPNDTYQQESIDDFVSKIISKYDTFNKIKLKTGVLVLLFSFYFLYRLIATEDHELIKSKLCFYDKFLLNYTKRINEYISQHLNIRDFFLLFSANCLDVLVLTTLE